MKNELRYEIKYNVPVSMQHSIESMIRDHPAGFREVFIPRKIYTLYFDSFSFESFHESLEGCFSRKKIRLRWYTKPNPVGECFLQIKSKKNNLSEKFEEGIILPEEYFFDSLRNIRNFAYKTSSLRMKQMLDLNPQPSLLVSYYRKYYLSLDRVIRITLDDTISFYQQATRFSINHFADSNFNKNSILEIKFDPKDIKKGKSVARWFPFDYSRQSKYINGVSSFL